jgi:hypothetical protein
LCPSQAERSRRYCSEIGAKDDVGVEKLDQPFEVAGATAGKNASTT